MNDFLHKDEYVPYAPDEANGQVRINHADCPAGEDTKRRLYIKRCDDGLTILAFCHHCRKRGKYNSFAEANIEAAKKRYSHGRSTNQESGRTVQIPKTAEYDTAKWPSRARAWLFQYGITVKEIKDHGIFYNPDNMRVGIPSFSKFGVAVLQYRKIFEEREPSDSPKYLTIRSSNSRLFSSGLDIKSNICVLTEDAISAIRCGRYLPSYALTGTYLTDEELFWIVSGYEEYVIFLDDDNADVRRQELILKNRLDVFGKARIIHTRKDPKEYTDQELKELLDKH